MEIESISLCFIHHILCLQLAGVIISIGFILVHNLVSFQSSWDIFIVQIVGLLYLLFLRIVFLQLIYEVVGAFTLSIL